jgi:hypothetical protein
VNTLNKQLVTDAKRSSSSLQVRRGTNNFPLYKNKRVMRIMKENWTYMDSPCK